MSSSTKKMIVLKTSDDESFEVEESVALKSETIKHMIEDDCADGIIPIPNVTSTIMAKVIEYCKRHVEASNESSAVTGDNKSGEDDFKAFDTEFLKVDQNVLFDLILPQFLSKFVGACGARSSQTVSFRFSEAANYLDIKSSLDLTCQSVADMMKGKTPEEIRKTFNIKNDYTPEEEAEVHKENAWAFE